MGDSFTENRLLRMEFIQMYRVFITRCLGKAQHVSLSNLLADTGPVTDIQLVYRFSLLHIILD